MHFKQNEKGNKKKKRLCGVFPRPGSKKKGDGGFCRPVIGGGKCDQKRKACLFKERKKHVGKRLFIQPDG